MIKRNLPYIEIIIATVFFGLAVFVSIYFKDVFVKAFSNLGWIGMLLYVLITITSMVAAPVNTVPLIPIATALWGVVPTALITIAAWTIGALISFGIARMFSDRVTNRFTSVKKLQWLEQHIPKKNFFWALILLRISFPFDILNYAIGLFSSVSWKMFTVTAIISLTPMAFVFAGISEISPFFIMGISIIFIVVSVFYFRKLRRIVSDQGPDDKNLKIDYNT